MLQKQQYNNYVSRDDIPDYNPTLSSDNDVTVK